MAKDKRAAAKRREPTRASAKIKAAPAGGRSSREAAPRGIADGADGVDEMARLREACETLGAELAAAKLRIATLESARAQALNRVDWVIDSLQTALADRAPAD